MDRQFESGIMSFTQFTKLSFCQIFISNMAFLKQKLKTPMKKQGVGDWKGKNKKA